MEKDSVHKAGALQGKSAIVEESSKVGKSNNPSMHLLKLEEIYYDESHQIKKMAYGKPRKGFPSHEKVILLIGATGSGKTTLINTMINYILGVEWKDPFRFLLVHDEGSGSQSQSQTKSVTAYTIHHQDFFSVSYTVTIVDTPGFADTEGIQRDKEIHEQLRLFFSTRGISGIDHIDSVGFVTQACLPRLTASQKYVFDTILAMFGKDIAENIYLLITFADAQRPPVLDGVKAAKVPYKKSFKFNSAGIFCANVKKTEDADSDEEEDVSFSKNFWTLGMKSCHRYFLNLNNVTSKTLALTKGVLDERNHLEVHIQGLHTQRKSTLNHMNRLKHEVNMLKECEAGVNRSEKHTYEVTEEKIVKVDIPFGLHVTNCLKCNFTCHFPCRIAKDENKDRCAAMDKSGHCIACPAHCHWQQHHNSPFKMEIEEVKVTKTIDELKAQYEQAIVKKMSSTQIIEEVQHDIEAESMKALALTEKVRQSLQRLQEIALRPDPLSQTDYIDILIVAEKDGNVPGWTERIEQLKDIRTKAQIMENMADKAYNILQEYERIAAKEGKIQGTTESTIWRKVFNGFSQLFH